MAVNTRSTAGHQYVGIKIGREVSRIKNASLARNILNAYDHYISITTDSKDFSDLKKYIAVEAEKLLAGINAQTVTFIVEEVECGVAFRLDRYIDPENIKRLKEILQSKYKMLVDEKTTYKPTKKLLEMAEQNGEIAELIELRPLAASFKFAIKEV